MKVEKDEFWPGIEVKTRDISIASPKVLHVTSPCHSLTYFGTFVGLYARLLGWICQESHRGNGDTGCSRESRHCERETGESGHHHELRNLEICLLANSSFNRFPAYVYDGIILLAEYMF